MKGKNINPNLSQQSDGGGMIREVNFFFVGWGGVCFLEGADSPSQGRGNWRGRGNGSGVFKWRPRGVWWL